MKTIKLEDGDFKFEDGDFVLTSNDIDQSLYLILSTRKGECFYNRDFGINRENILGKVKDSSVRNEIIGGIAQEERVEVIDGVDVGREGRGVAVSFKVQVQDEGDYESEVFIGARSSRL